jgi:hypothetical protein
MSQYAAYMLPSTNTVTHSVRSTPPGSTDSTAVAGSGAGELAGADVRLADMMCLLPMSCALAVSNTACSQSLCSCQALAVAGISRDVYRKNIEVFRQQCEGDVPSGLQKRWPASAGGVTSQVFWHLRRCGGHQVAYQHTSAVFASCRTQRCGLQHHNQLLAGPCDTGCWLAQPGTCT